MSTFLLPLAVAASHEPDPETSGCDLSLSDSIITADTLSVMTLNLAHGRKDGFNQMLQKTSTTRRNLEEIAAFFSKSGADLIALQEADYASRWSGRFNHVNFISARSPYPYRVHAHNAVKYMYDFGTALLSRVRYTEKLTHTFTPSPPTTNKGFVMGSVCWNPGGQWAAPITVSVISVHLDFSRKKVREAQVEEMRKILPDISTPAIILGDFNTDWEKDKSALRAIVETGNLKAYQPEAVDLGTYKKGKRRLDWILISKDLEFVSYNVPQVVLSDHQPVQASIKLIAGPSQAADK